MNNCINCRFVQLFPTEEGAEPHAECRRRAPAVAVPLRPSQQKQTVWPSVHPEEGWCGDFGPHAAKTMDLDITIDWGSGRGAPQ